MQQNRSESILIKYELPEIISSTLLKAREDLGISVKILEAAPTRKYPFRKYEMA